MPHELASARCEVSSSSGWERLRFLCSETPHDPAPAGLRKQASSGRGLARTDRVLMTYLEEVAYLRRTGQLGESSAKSEPSWRTTGRLWKN